VRERKEANRTREAGHLDEIQGVVASTLNAFPGGAVGFIDWLDLITSTIIIFSLINHVPISFNRNEVDVVMTGVLV
jgi:hypothetical protein